MATPTVVTLADLANKDHAINTDGLTWDRKRVAIASDHVYDAPTNNNVKDNRAIFEKEAHGHPWVLKAHLEKVVFKAVGAAPHVVPTNATVIFPNHDYTEFQ